MLLIPVKVKKKLNKQQLHQLFIKNYNNGNKQNLLS